MPGPFATDSLVLEIETGRPERYRVSVVEVPDGESLQMGSVAARHDREGGGDLVTLSIRESVPDDWVVEETTLADCAEDRLPECPRREGCLT